MTPASPAPQTQTPPVAQQAAPATPPSTPGETGTGTTAQTGPVASAPATSEADKITITPQSAIDANLPQIQLMFNGDCWVDIVDAQGRRLAYQLGKFPQVLSVRGKAPFTLILGNAPNVKLTYQGKDIDITKGHTSVYVATTLGTDADNASTKP